MVRTRGILFWQGVAVFVLALALVSWSAYDASRRLWLNAGGETPATGSAGNASHIPGSRNIDYSISEIRDAHIFGKVEAPEKKEVTQAPETKLKIKLLGLVSSTGRQHARAIIGVNGASPESYGVGQTIKGTNATIQAVETKRVLIKRGGAVESLSLKVPRLYTENDSESRSSGDAGGS